jgi:hypothetical protein
LEFRIARAACIDVAKYVTNNIDVIVRTTMSFQSWFVACNNTSFRADPMAFVCRQVLVSFSVTARWLKFDIKKKLVLTRKRLAR